MTKTQRARRITAAITSCVIYVRVSTEEQKKSGLGIEAQITECRAFAERNGIEVTEVIIEEPVSGKVTPFDRPRFPRVLALLAGCDGCALLVRRQDRISRKLTDTLAVVAHSREAGFNIMTTDGKLDTTSAAGRAHINFMATVAEFERELIAERTREALAALKASGKVLGRAPELDAEVVARIVAERAAGRSIGAIANGLVADGVATVRGGPWSRSSVQSVLSSERVARGNF